tara:strand:+ start:85 stop:339 length:255 start_codon:yes stop_codon:yes gene_type:complete
MNAKLRIIKKDANNPIEVFFYLSQEGKRPHLHVLHKDGTEAKVWLDTLTLKQSSGDAKFDSLAVKLVSKHQEEGIAAYNEIYGE